MAHILERETRVELATFSLEGWRSTNWATPAWYNFVVPRAGLEPARDKFPQDFKSCASTDFATKALVTLFLVFLLLTHNYSISISYLNYIVNTFFRFFYIFFKSVLYNQMQQKNILKKHSKNDILKSLTKLERIILTM